MGLLCSEEPSLIGMSGRRAGISGEGARAGRWGGTTRKRWEGSRESRTIRQRMQAVEIRLRHPVEVCGGNVKPAGRQAGDAGVRDRAGLLGRGR